MLLSNPKFTMEHKFQAMQGHFLLPLLQPVLEGLLLLFSFFWGGGGWWGVCC